MAEISKPNMSAIWADAGAVIAPNDAKLRLGWTAEVPPHQWENFIQNRQDKAIAYIFQMGIPQWDETTEYFANKSVVVHNGRLYIAKASNTNSSPSVSAANWKLALDADKLASIAHGAEVNKVNSVAGKVGVVVLNKSDVGLSNVDDTSDLDKPISTATQSALNFKAPSSHVGSTGSAHGVATTSKAGFMSHTDKAKLDGMASGAQVNTVTSVAGKTGAVTLTKGDVGLSNVDDTSDMDKPVSTAQLRKIEEAYTSFSDENYDPYRTPDAEDIKPLEIFTELEVNGAILSGMWLVETTYFNDPTSPEIGRKRAIQRASSVHYGEEFTGSVYIRSWVPSAPTEVYWSPWIKPDFGRNIEDVSGVVGLVANGAVIERGSNANGEYVKFADGTMICTMTIYSPSIINWTNGTGLGHKYSDEVFATIPHAFIARPSLSYAPVEEAVASRSGWISYLNASNSTCFLHMSALTTTSNTQPFSVLVTLIGRWK